MGWAYYGANKMDQAIEEWKRAERLRPDPEVEQALAKAERDKSEEESYREGETAHFDLKYYGGATPDLARGILRALEDDFRDLESQLDYTPPEQIAVILYTEQAFADITRAPGWVGALNDGRLRIPVQGLTRSLPIWRACSSTNSRTASWDKNRTAARPLGCRKESRNGWKGAAAAQWPEPC